MMQQSQDEYLLDEGSLIIRFNGGRATNSALSLERYATSLRGWSDLFRLLSRLYQNSIGGLRGVPNRTALAIEIRAERSGSYQAVIQYILRVAAEGVVGNRTDALVAWTFKKLMKFFRDATRSYVRAKTRTTNVDEIVAALEQMATGHNVILELIPPEEERTRASDAADVPEEEPPQREIFHAKRLIAEKIDVALRDATGPLDQDCTEIELVQANGQRLLTFDGEDRVVIDKPLELPVPEGIWKQLPVRFERINRKTGRALVYFGDAHSSETASYARIVDTAVHRAGDPYTAALSVDTPLIVWARQVRAERGKLNPMWELTAQPPGQLSLFGPDGSRA